MEDSVKHCGVPGVCVRTKEVFKNDGCIEKERAKQKTGKGGGRRKARINKAGSESENRNKEGTKTPKRSGKSTNGNIPIAYRNSLSIKPLVSAMTHDTLNTLGKVTISRGDSSVITRLLRLGGPAHTLRNFQTMIHSHIFSGVVH